MRLFQNAGLYPRYLPRLDALDSGPATFAARRDAFLADRFGACHLLQPVLAGAADAFFTNADDARLQRRWAREHGLSAAATPEQILLAQIEEHRTEVLYNLDPLRFGSDFVRRLPGHVRCAIAWRAAPSPGADFAAYDRVVCNFPAILAGYAARGWKTAWFAPAHDPEMDRYAARTDRPVDVVFVGGYTRHHRRRAEILEAVAQGLRGRNVRLHLDRSRATALAESLPGRLLPLAKHRRPPEIRAASAAPVFGRALYEALAGAKIVLNGAVDMAGDERGNMRCFEAMGCGALMVSDAGRYPPGMEDGRTLLAYASPQDAVRAIERALADDGERRRIAAAGHRAMVQEYSKDAQWRAFESLVAAA